MYLLLSLNDFETENINFDEKQKNNMIEDSDFYMIHYITDECIIHNVILSFELKNINISKYFNKYKCQIGIENGTKLRQLDHIEQGILKMFLNYICSKDENVIKNLKKYKPKYSLHEQITHGVIKTKHIINPITIDTNEVKHLDKINMVIKISGIWMTEFEYGMIYKIIIV